MADPKVILWISVNGLLKCFFTRVMVNFVKNSYLFEKFVIELVAL